MILRKITIFLALLLAAVASAQTVKTQHVVKHNETLYGIANQYHVSPDDIRAINPQISQGLRAGMTLKIPGEPVAKAAGEKPGALPADKPAAPGNAPAPKVQAQQPVANTPQPATKAQEPAKEAATVQPLTHKVAPGETFYGIATSYGLTTDRLMELNSFIDPYNLRIGTVLRLADDAPLGFDAADNDRSLREPIAQRNQLATPVVAVEEVAEETETEDIEQPEEAVSAPTVLEACDRTIVIILPFMLDEETPSRHARYNTEFLKGFLLAADQLKDNPGGNHVEIVVVDNANSADRTSAELAKLDPEDIAVIVAPEDNAQLDVVNRYAAENDIFAFNIFNIKDEAYRTNARSIQANINQADMYSKAIAGLEEAFPGFTPVIIGQKGGAAEKEAFTSQVKAHYAANGRPVREIEFETVLSPADLEELSPDSSYVFIPRSGSMGLFNKFASAIRHYRSEDSDPARIGLFGYPDWTTFRNEPLDELHNLGAVIYSRFFLDPESPEAVFVADSFRRHYGEDMAEIVPSQGMLGYDTGMFLIQNAARRTFTDELPLFDNAYQGVQNSFFIPSDRINSALYIVRFLPGDAYDVSIR